MTKTQLQEAQEAYRRRSDFIYKATIETIIGETDAQREERVKRLLKPENYGDFFDYYFGIDTAIPMADSRCARFHIDSYVELFRMPVINQFRLWSRSFAKSVHSNVGNIFGLKQCGLTQFHVTVGINQDRANLLLADLQIQLESNQRIIADFGEQKVYGGWADGEFETMDGCYFLSLGIDQPFRGLRRLSNRVTSATVDDIEDREVAKNERMVCKRGEKITSDLIPAFSKDKKRLIVANNFIENKGVIAWIKDKKKDSKYTRISWVNWVDERGNSPWPERFDKDATQLIIDDTDPITYKREYLQTPVTEGAIIKQNWIVHKTPKPLHEYRVLLGHWDLSYTSEGDYKAFALVGATANEIHVLDVYCRKGDLTEATDYHFNLVKKLRKSGATAIFYYDATAAQEEIFGDVWTMEAAKHKCYEIPLPAHTNVDKYLRIEATLVNLLFNKRLFFADYLKDAPDFKTGKDQLLVFEKGSRAHDDFPDTLEAACRLVQGYTYPEDSNFKPVIGRVKRGGY